RYAAATPDGHRFAGKPTLDARDDPERVLALRPDLLIASDMVAPSFAARLREHGVQVFVLPAAQGLSTLLPSIRVIGALLGEPARAARYGDALARRMHKVSADLAASSPRPRALYLSSYGSRLFAAARHTSYHDAITHAGLRDAAAEGGLTGWPELTAEQVLTLDPDVLITRTGMSAVLCRHPGLTELRSCRDAGRSIELDGALLDDPGPGLLEATEAIHDAFWTR
ncbi:MAG: ABC transporter substrate-binding protein, partial [Polyangiales bacterium]